MSEHALQQASYESTAGLRVADGQSSQYWFTSAPAAHAPASRVGGGQRGSVASLPASLPAGSAASGAALRPGA